MKILINIFLLGVILLSGVINVFIAFLESTQSSEFLFKLIFGLIMIGFFVLFISNEIQDFREYIRSKNTINNTEFDITTSKYWVWDDNMKRFQLRVITEYEYESIPSKRLTLDSEYISSYVGTAYLVLGKHFDKFYNDLMESIKS